MKLSVLKNKSILIVFNRLHYLILHRMHLLERLKKEGFRIEVLGGGTPQEIATLENAGITVHPISVDSFKLKPFQDFSIFWRIRSVIARSKFDIVNIHSIKMMILTQTAVRTLLPRDRPKALLNSFAGLGRMFFGEASFLMRSARWMFLRSLAIPSLGKHERIIVETDADKNDLSTMGSIQERRFSVSVGAGIDTKKYSPAPVIETEDTKPISFLFAGRLLKSKGVLEYMAAAEEVLKSGVSAEFKLAGRIEEDDPDGIKLTDFVSIHNLPGFSYLGSLNASKMPELLANTDVVCLASSYREGIPRILLEAASSGCSFIATNIPGWRQVTGESEECGWFIEAPTRENLVAAFKDAISDPVVCREKGNNSRKMILEGGLDEAHVQDRVLDAYSRALSGT